MAGHKLEKKESLGVPVSFEIIVPDVGKQNFEKIRSLLSQFGQDFYLDDRNKFWVSYEFLDNVKKTVKKVKPVELKKLNYPAVTTVIVNGVELLAQDAGILFQAAGIDYAIQGKVLYVGKQFFS